MEPLMDDPFHKATNTFGGRRQTARTPRVTPDLVEWLMDTFKPRCIKPGERLEEAHRYAGKVELAETIIKMAQNGDRVDYSFEVDR